MDRRTALRHRATPWLEELHALVPPVRARLLRPLVRFREMQHPTFSRAAHETMAYRDDYFRYATLGLAVQRVLDEGIEGAFAEVGVWRGDTSVILHQLAPDRRLYLFDSFAGFPDRDLPAGHSDLRFRATSAEAVARRLGHAPNVVLCPGLVPETLERAAGERFALALLDLDLFEPTRASLEFFYARLAPGGYLFMHDYNNPESDWACKRAFDSFLAERPEQIVEIGDTWGSALIRRAR